MEYRESYEEWLKNPYFDDATKEELRSIADDDNEIKERFYKELEFGTAGLRGVIGAGTNRMNIYTVRKATQGLANYIIKNNGQAKGVAIAYDSAGCPRNLPMKRRAAWRQTGSRRTFSNLCARRRNFLMQSAGWERSPASTLRPATTRRNTMATKCTGKTAPRLLRLTTRASWMR